MKTRSKLMSRLLSLALCICMVLALLPAIPLVANAANFSGGTTLCLKPNANWTISGARFAAYFFNNSTNKNAWVSMSDANGNGIYECQAPSGTWANVIFCRMDPNKSANNWTSGNDGGPFWNKTSDLTFDGTKNLYTVKEGTWDQGGGSWSVAPCQDSGGHTYNAQNKCTSCSKSKCVITNGHTFKSNLCSVCGTEEVAIYFHNNWKWSDVKIHYWTTDGVSTTWPGVDVGDYGNIKEEWYSVMTVPADVTGFIISGINGETGLRDQTIDLSLTGYYEGLTYYIAGVKSTDDQGKQTCTVGDYAICKDFSGKEELHNFVNNVCDLCDKEKCAVLGHSQGVDDDVCTVCGVELMDIYFENNWKWSNVRLYYWYKDKRDVPSYPGVSMKLYGTNDGNEYFGLKVPDDPEDPIAGFTISGNSTGSENYGAEEETVDITDWYDGATYYVSDRKDNKCEVLEFPICVDFPKNHNFVDGICTYCHYPEYIYVYFQNNWDWTEVKIGYNGSRIAPAQGDTIEEMERYGNNDTYDIYRLLIPADCDEIWFSGYDSGKDGGVYNASPKITSGWTQGITYYMIWDTESQSNKTGNYLITKDFPCALGHTEEIIPAVAPTCVDTGWTAGVKCSVCDEILTAQLEVPATGNHADVVVKEDGRCDVCDCLMQDVYLAYTTASLEGNIAVNYFMLLSDEVLADKDAYMQFTMADDQIIKVPVSKSKLIDGYDVFTCEVAAKEMTDIITSQFYYGGKVALEHQYNVRAYAKHIIQNSDDPNAKALMEAMVNYGAASQLHFGYNDKDLADDVRDKEGNLLITVPDYENTHINGFDFTPGQGTDKVKLYSASLILNSETTLRLFFNGKISATYNNKKLDVKQRSGLYYVDIVDIAAKDLDEDVEITINDGTKSAKITFSPMAYCQIVEKDDSDYFTTEMKNLAIALYLYNQAANNYFENRG